MFSLLHRHQPLSTARSARRAGRTGPGDLRRVAPAARRVVALLHERWSLHQLCPRSSMPMATSSRSSEQGAGSISRLAAISGLGRGAPRLPVYQQATSTCASAIRDYRPATSSWRRSARLSLDKFDNAYFRATRARPSIRGRETLVQSQRDFLSLRFVAGLLLETQHARHGRALRHHARRHGADREPVPRRLFFISGYQPWDERPALRRARVLPAIAAAIQIAPTYGASRWSTATSGKTGATSRSTSTFCGSMFSACGARSGPHTVGLAEHGRRSAFLYLGPVF